MLTFKGTVIRGDKSYELKGYFSSADSARGTFYRNNDDDKPDAPPLKTPRGDSAGPPSPPFAPGRRSLPELPRFSRAVVIFPGRRRVLPSAARPASAETAASP